MADLIEYRLPLADASFIANPYPLLGELRRETAAFYDPAQQVVFFTRFSQIRQILGDRRFGRTRPADAPQRAAEDSRWAAIEGFESNHFFDKEPPEHTRLKGLVGRAFTPQRVLDLRPRIELAVNDLLERTFSGKFVEFIADFAEPLPVTIIAELLGIPQSERRRLRPWSQAIVALYEPDFGEVQLSQAAQAVVEFSSLLSDLLHERRRQPQDDLISALASVEEQGARLNADELVATCILLLNAGHEATVNSLGLGLQALLHHPEQAAILATAAQGPSEAEIFKVAVEELLRFDTPLPLFERRALQDVEIAGLQLKAGQEIGLLYVSANRDPQRFSHPDALDLQRSDNPHLTFGLGIHYCLGAPLARLELQVAFQALFRRLARSGTAFKLSLAGEAMYKPGFVVRGLQNLHLEL